jgi:hypothetical protein
MEGQDYIIVNILYGSLTFSQFLGGYLNLNLKERNLHSVCPNILCVTEGYIPQALLCLRFFNSINNTYDQQIIHKENPTRCNSV